MFTSFFHLCKQTVGNRRRTASQGHGGNCRHFPRKKVAILMVVMVPVTVVVLVVMVVMVVVARHAS